MKKAIVTGAGGFIGYHLVNYLVDRDYWVRGIDMKYPEFGKIEAQEFELWDLRKTNPHIFYGFDEVYHLAADMGGIGYIETNKAEIVYNNTLINMNVLDTCQYQLVDKFLFTSSACVYPGYLQAQTKVSPLKESDAYPADAEDGYGWEKLMMERACRHYMEDYGLQTYVVRFHNIYGPCGTYQGGREKSPAAICRKIASVKDGDTIEIWGDGTQTRSYCYIDDCVNGIYRLMQSDYHKPINIGSDRIISIDELVNMVAKIAGKKIRKRFDINKPQGVKGRNADISLAKEVLAWQPTVPLEKGMQRTYEWIKERLYSA